MIKGDKKHDLTNLKIYAIVCVIATIIFISIYGIYVLNPFYTDFLLQGGDLSQHYLGWRAFRESNWMFPFGCTDFLTYPSKISLIYTDSIPIFSILFKLFSNELPQQFQFFGLWSLLCIILQGVFAAKIIKHYTDNTVAIILASILFCYAPIMLWRILRHSSLSAQFLILFCLEMLLSYKENEKRNEVYIRLIVLGIITPMIHQYFILMSGIIIIGICLQDILMNKRVIESVKIISAFIVPTTFVDYLLGGFYGNIGAKAPGLGKFSANINALFNPQDWSTIFKNLELYNMGQYEGFGYIGAGFILLLVIALVFLFINEKRKEILTKNSILIVSLLVVFTISSIVSFSPIITFNDKLVSEIKVPNLLLNIWEIFRASGRIIWIPAYICMFCICIVVVKLCSKKQAIIILAIALCLQIYDIKEPLKGKNADYNKIVQYSSYLQNQSFWKMVGENERIKHVVMVSDLNYDALYSFADWAFDYGKTINRFYFARENAETVDLNLHKELEQLSSDDLFIFEQKDILEADIHNLYYYKVDNFIVGSVEPITGYTQLKSDEFKNVWWFGENKFTENAEDVDGVRRLYSDGVSRGPGWGVNPGKYVIEIYGTDIRKNINVAIASDEGENLYPYDVLQEDEGMIRIYINFERKIDDLEIVISNVSTGNIDLSHIEMKKYEEE